jgi:hypothetical protein
MFPQTALTTSSDPQLISTLQSKDVTVHTTFFKKKRKKAHGVENFLRSCQLCGYF